MTETVRSAAEFGRVAVLLGGWSAEREVSLDSGAQVLAALQRCGVDAVGVDATPAKVLNLREAGFDRAFVMLHGPGGEDGQVQAALDLQAMPYTGCGFAASALAMDKLRTKRVWQGLGLPTPEFVEARDASQARAFMERIEGPVFVKPNTQGSSVGMSRVDELADIGAAFEAARQFDARVIVERFVAGAEYTAAMLGASVLPLIRIQVASTYYDYHAKYHSDDTRYECPAALDEARTRQWQTLSREAFDALGCSAWGRVDFIADTDGQAWLLEVNTVPGMTSHSLVPMAARAAGMDFDALCMAILEQSMEARP